jgi:hypothetical protein
MIFSLLTLFIVLRNKHAHNLQLALLEFSSISIFNSLLQPNEPSNKADGLDVHFSGRALQSCT